MSKPDSVDRTKRLGIRWIRRAIAAFVRIDVFSKHFGFVSIAVRTMPIGENGVL